MNTKHTPGPWKGNIMISNNWKLPATVVNSITQLAYLKRKTPEELVAKILIEYYESNKPDIFDAREKN